METQTGLFNDGKKKQLLKEDKSNIGEWDPKIIELCKKKKQIEKEITKLSKGFFRQDSLPF